MASKNEVLETLGLLVTLADDAEVVAELNATIVRLGGTPSQPASAPAAAADTTEASEASEADVPKTAVEETVEVETVDTPTVPRLAGADVEDVDAELNALMGLEEPAAAADEVAPPNEGDALDVLGYLGGQIDAVGDGALRDATPRTLTLHIRAAEADLVSEDGRAAATELATEIATGVLPSIVAVVGEVTIGETAVGDDAVTVVLDLSETNDGAALAQMAGQIGLPVFEAHWPVGPVTYTVSALAGAPADLELARLLGLAAPEDFEMPVVPEGQHAINGGLDLAEAELGFRPEAATFMVVYRRDGGEAWRELTAEQVERIVAHPISQGGLRRIGNLAFLGVEPADDANAKVARFGILDAGEINPATLALGAAAYRGTFDFGGDIGVISANAEVTLVGVDVEV